MNKLYKKLPLHKTAQNIRLSLHSFVIARHKERNGNTNYINLKNLQNSSNTFSIQKEPSRFINLFNFLAFCPSSKSERVPLFAKKLASFTSSFSPTYLSKGQYRVSFFHFEEHFHHQEKRFLICERTCPDLLLQISLVKPKKPI